MNDKDKKSQIVCPVCGYRMPIFYTGWSESKGVYVTCKGRGCKTVFEIKVKKGEQIK